MDIFRKSQGSGDELLDTCLQYIETCKASKRMPTLYGFLACTDFDRTEWDEYREANKRSLAQGIKKCQDRLVSAILEYASANPGMQPTCIFYCKAVFGLHDRPYEDKSTTNTVNITLDKSWSELGK